MHRTRGATHLVTGVTGFVGGALTLELLRTHKRDRALCVVRGADPLHARRRVVDALTAAAAAYGVGRNKLPSILGRVTALRGDITAPGLALSDTDREVLTTAGPLTVWHSAATLKDTEEAFREIIDHNVGGTRNVLETVLRYQVDVFNQVSTAYVAGRKSGVVGETLERPRGFSNRYEQSKHYGEMMVADLCGHADVPYRILRPGIVIGHSRTARATGYTGFFGWVLKLAALDEAAGGALRRQSLRYVARENAPLNVVPIDSIVEDAIGIDAAHSATHDRVFHLTCANPPTIRWLCDQVTGSLGLRPVEIVDREAELDPVSAKFHRWTRFERPYTTIRKQFSRVASNPLYPSPRHGACLLTPRLIDEMTRLAVVDYRYKQAARARMGAA